MNRGWTTPGDIAEKVKRRWDDGSLLRGYGTGEPMEPIVVTLRGPTPAQIGDDVTAVRDWVTELDAGSRGGARYTLEWKSVGGRKFGRNELPTRASVSSYEQAWALLNVASTVRRFDELLTYTAHLHSIRQWIIDHPHRALELQPQLPQLIAAYEWLDKHRQSWRYLREISAPGVDTKFAERHRPELAGMLGVSTTPAGFLADLGLRSKPALVRLRPAASLGLPALFTELAVRAEELAELAVHPRLALIVENEISYLSAEVPHDGVVIWGKGFEIDRVGRLPWLADTDVVYWGDIDTHGFAILDRLRAWIPQARSVLMDSETLHAHHDRWVTEDRPSRALLTRLTAEEDDLYRELVTDVFGERLRLEQERIDWRWAEQRLSRVCKGQGLGLMNGEGVSSS